MRLHRLEREQIVSAPVSEVFEFFARAENLELITPPWLGFRVLSPTPIQMRVGTLIEYRLRLHRLPLRWISRIDEWVEQRSFVDRQVRGPYRIWHHRHEFAPSPAGTGTAAVSAGAVSALLYAWFATVLVSVIYVAYDAFTKNPELKVMKWGWVLVTLYIGPIGAALYVLSCKEPSPGTHEQFVAPLWKQSLGSTIHCVAGDATGIVVASVITTAAGLAMWGDTIVEYVAGFGFGLLVFQALFMRDMLGGSYVAAVRSTVIPEWLSMNCVMAGMVVVMVIIRTHAKGTTDVGDVRFWGVLSLAVLTGLIVAYPVNVWLVAKQLKHGMGTVRALGEGGEPLAHQPATSAQGGHEAMEMKPVTVTTAEINAVATLTIVLLAAGVVLAGALGNFSA